MADGGNVGAGQAPVTDVYREWLVKAAQLCAAGGGAAGAALSPAPAAVGAAGGPGQDAQPVPQQGTVAGAGRRPIQPAGGSAQPQDYHQQDYQMQSALGGTHLQLPSATPPATPPPDAGAPARPGGQPAVSLGPVPQFDTGAAQMGQMLAGGDRQAADIRAQQERDDVAANWAPPSEGPCSVGPPAAETGSAPRPGGRVPPPAEHNNLGDLGAALYHGANTPFVAVDRGLSAVSDWGDEHVPGMATLDGLVGSTPETREAHLRDLDALEADYQQAHGGSRLAHAADVTGQVGVGVVAAALTGGASALPELTGAGVTRAVAANAAQKAAPTIFGQSMRTAAVNAGVGCVSGGISGGLSDGTSGAAVGCAVGGSTNVVAPALANGTAQALSRLGHGPLIQGFGAGVTYTTINGTGGAMSQFGANLAVGRDPLENVGRAALVGAAVTLASGDTAFTAAGTVVRRPVAASVERATIPEAGGYALTGQSGIFGIGATIGTNAYDAKRSVPTATDTPDKTPPTGLYIGTGARFSGDERGGL